MRADYIRSHPGRQKHSPREAFANGRLLDSGVGTMGSDVADFSGNDLIATVLHIVFETIVEFGKINIRGIRRIGSQQRFPCIEAGQIGNAVAARADVIGRLVVGGA